MILMSNQYQMILVLGPDRG